MLEPDQTYTNLLLLVSPGITTLTNLGCPTGGGYELYLFESDGGLNGSGDDFGRRFYSTLGSTGLPWGATIGGFQEFYSCYGNTIQPPPGYGCPPIHSARARLEFR